MSPSLLCISLEDRPNGFTEMPWSGCFPVNTGCPDPTRLKPPVVLLLSVFSHCGAPHCGPDARYGPTCHAFASWDLVCRSFGLAD